MWKTYHTPASIEEALRLLAEHGPEARVIAGGTDLLVELRRGVRQAPVLIDVTRIGGLDGARLDESVIHIGPTVTHNQVVACALLTSRALPLAQACWQVGTPALRNRATVVGNLVTASPANDTITALCALDAFLTLRSVGGERIIPLEGFYQGVRRTDLQPDELVTEIAFPAFQANQRGAFVKLGLRRAHAIALVNAAVVLTSEAGLIARARIALGSVAPTIIRSRAAEEALVGGALTAERIARTADLAALTAAPIDDVRAGAAYRREMVRVLVRRALSALQAGAEGSMSPAAQRSGLPHNPPMLWGHSDGHFPHLGARGLRHSEGGPEPIECTVNGERVAIGDAASKTLLDMLREDLGLTGTKEGCGEGECGACTVWMDGIAVLACLVPAPRAHGTEIVTVEGLARGGELHPVQQAFIDEGAVQCGYCTPGFVMAGANLLAEIPHPTGEQIIAGLSGNLCRCTGYYTIVRAVERAAEVESANGSTPQTLSVP
ncbi:MAG: FAD binding domain-containing protein [Anaerolineae bacterium]|nr:FAD binding domain-containing protein [Anaerolineae bacterium]